MGRIREAEKLRRYYAKKRMAGIKEIGPRKISLEELAALICHETKPLLPTQRDFIFCPDFVALYMGPLGSGKTTSLLASGLTPALLYPGSRWFCARAHWTYMEDTILQPFREMLDRIGSDCIIDELQGPPNHIWIRPGREGPPVEFVFHSLDDLRKLGGTKFTGVLLSEVNEIEESIATTLAMRCRHPLPGQDRPVGPFFWRAECNPVRRSHWVHRKFCNEHDCDPKPWGKKFRPNRKENELNLPPGYYEEQAAGLSPELRIRFIEGECGPDPMGQAVFPEFRHSIHVDDLEMFPGVDGMIGFDFGRRRPAAVLAQRRPDDGGIDRLKSILGQSETTRQFGNRLVQVCNMEFPLIRNWVVFCDPHGRKQESSAEETDIQILNSIFPDIRYRDVSKKRRIELMSEGLCTLTKMGRPRSRFDREGCAYLIEGYGGGYHFPEATPGRRFVEEPVADGYYEHGMDADGYIEVNTHLGSTVHNKPGQKRVLRKIRPQSVTGYS